MSRSTVPETPQSRRVVVAPQINTPRRRPRDHATSPTFDSPPRKVLIAEGEESDEDDRKRRRRPRKELTVPISRDGDEAVQARNSPEPWEARSAVQRNRDDVELARDNIYYIDERHVVAPPGSSDSAVSSPPREDISMDHGADIADHDPDTPPPRTEQEHTNDHVDPELRDAIREAILNSEHRRTSFSDSEFPSSPRNHGGPIAEEDNDFEVDNEVHGFEDDVCFMSGIMDAPEDPEYADEVARAVEAVARDFPELLISDEDELRRMDGDQQDPQKAFEYRTKSILTNRDLVSLALYQIKTRGNVARETHRNYVQIVASLVPRGKPREIRAVQRMIQRVSGIAHVKYDRCIKGCVCYAKYPDLTVCPKPRCNEPRYDSAGRPRAVFEYIPITHQIRLMWGDRAKAKYLREYRAALKLKQGQERGPDPDEETEASDKAPHDPVIRDFWDAKLVKQLQRKGMLTEESDLAFFFSTDGVSLFRTGKPHQVWPLMMTCYNLAPDLRFNENNVMCLGIVPGPKKPWDLDSFLGPMVLEFERFHNGVPDVWDAYRKAPITARAYITVVGADMPAKDQLMGLQGLGSKRPCNYCTLRGVWGSNHMYAPLNVPNGKYRMPSNYDPLKLPNRQHDKGKHDADHVKRTDDPGTKERSGIKERVCFWDLPSIIWPWSYALDNMHLLYLNVATLMRNHWRGHVFRWEKKPNAFGSAQGDPFKDTGESYCIPPATWEEVNKDLAESARNLPSFYGDPLRPVHEMRKAAEWKLWLHVLSPLVLKDRLPPQAYQHWMTFVRAVTVATDYNITVSEVEIIRHLLATFVQEYETIYYRYEHARLPACRVVIHALLHVADSIEWIGPMWSCAQWTIERMCGLWTPKVKLKNLADRNLSLSILRSLQVNAMGSTADLLTLDQNGDIVRLSYTGADASEELEDIDGTHDLNPRTTSLVELSPLWGVILARVQKLQLRQLAASASNAEAASDDELSDDEGAEKVVQGRWGAEIVGPLRLLRNKRISTATLHFGRRQEYTMKNDEADSLVRLIRATESPITESLARQADRQKRADDRPLPSEVRVRLWRLCKLNDVGHDQAMYNSYVRSVMFQASNARDASWVEYVGRDKKNIREISETRFGRVVTFFDYLDAPMVLIEDIPTVRLPVVPLLKETLAARKAPPDVSTSARSNRMGRGRGGRARARDPVERPSRPASAKLADPMPDIHPEAHSYILQRDTCFLMVDRARFKPGDPKHRRTVVATQADDIRMIVGHLSIGKETYIVNKFSCMYR